MAEHIIRILTVPFSPIVQVLWIVHSRLLFESPSASGLMEVNGGDV